MVKREIKTSLSEDDGESSILNENCKRPKETANKDGKKRIKTKSLYRQPTANELNRLQETENLFNSNLFRLQIEEILQEVKVKEKTFKKFTEWLTEFKKYALSIPEDETEFDLSEKVLAKHLKVKIPLSKVHDDTKVIFKFHKFNNIEVVGSYALGCSINSKLVVDLQITVPADTFNKNDSTNYKYHKKRAAYLAFIASHLNKTDLIEDLTYTFLNGCDTKPIMAIKPNGKLGNYLSVRLNLVCDSEAYKLHRFSPSRNNIRESWLFPNKNTDNTSEIVLPTPYYNNSVISDLTSSLNQEFLNKMLINSENLKQAVILLKIWARQRNLRVSGYVISMLIAYLVQSKRINNIMSSYQIIRNVWIALKSSEWDTKGISLSKNTTLIEEFHQHFPIVFIDTTGYYNICGQMSKGTYYAMRRECELAIDMLDNGKINSFIPLFMTPVTPLLQFDHILRFKKFTAIKNTILNRVPQLTKVSYGLDHQSLVSDTLYNLLARGLSSRVDLILPIVNSDFSWPVKKTLDNAAHEGHKEDLMFGFILNPDNALNIVDRGPPANMPEAEEFRAFWGDKSEVRRFQDGSITEACVWSADSLADRRDICRQVIEYLLRIKYDILPIQLYQPSQLRDITARRAGGKQLEEVTVSVLRAFDELRSDIRGLTQLPLEVAAVYGISPVFSYSDPCPPLPALAELNPRRRNDVTLLKDTSDVMPHYTPVNKAVIELTYSGKWPGDLGAFRCLKAAFHLQIADRLNKQYSLLTHAQTNYVDVLRDGYVFRLQIFHPKEIVLLKREVEGGVVKHRDSDESVGLHFECVVLPVLRGSLHGLHQKQPAFGPTVCLFKRWLSSHLLHNHFPSILCEALVAYTFLRAEPHRPTATPSVGLLRVLRLLAERDWSEMLILDFNDDMSKEDIAALERQFSSLSDGRPYMYVVTSAGGPLPAPPAPAARRARALAKAAEHHATHCLDTTRDGALEAFIPSLSGYDVIIRIKNAPYSKERIDAVPREPQGSVTELIPVVEFNPVQKYLDELQSSYSDFAAFFYDAYGGDVIAVLWKPDIHETREFQISSANALKPVTIKGETKYEVNIEAILEDFRILGEGLVTDVQMNSL